MAALRGDRRPRPMTATRSPTRCAPRRTRSSSRRRPTTADWRRSVSTRCCRPPEDRPLRILTHCNTGRLACGQFGTALGVVQAAHNAGRGIHVWVDETRPYLQGARLTAWELAQAGVPHTLHPGRRGRASHGPRRGRRRPRRGGPRRRQRRHREQGRDVPAGRARRAPRHPVLRLCADESRSTSRHAGRRRDPDRGAPGRGGAARSAACGSRRPAPRSATRPST